MNKLMTLGEVAERLHVSKATAHRLISEGVIPAVVLTRGSRRSLVRVREEALELAVGERERGRAQGRSEGSDEKPSRISHRSGRRHVKSKARS